MNTWDVLIKREREKYCESKHVGRYELKHVGDNMTLTTWDELRAQARGTYCKIYHVGGTSIASTMQDPPTYLPLTAHTHVEKVVTCHAWLTWHASRDDDDIATPERVT